MQAPNQDESNSEPRSFYLMLLFIQTIGLSTSTNIPNSAVHCGTLGYTLVYIALNIFLGIPTVYMELIIGQFTGLNSFDVWMVRPFISHMGYVMIFWQILILTHNHIVACFTLHYFLISFENPHPPYYKCGSWATANCDIITRNYTVNQDCIKANSRREYCDTLYNTFPEYQYWKYVILKMTDKSKFQVSWKLCLPSGIICIIVFLSCFKRKKSLKWILGTVTFYPVVAFLFLMMGSLLQKGIVIKFQEALDLDWSVFSERFRFAPIVEQVTFTLGAGTGLAVNLGASCPFRTPCFANTAITVIAGTAFTLLCVFTTAMMACPYSYTYDTSPYQILTTPITLLYERIPRMLQEYEHSYFWALIIYSCCSCLGVRTVVLIFYNLLELLAVKYPTVSKYPGLVTFIGMVVLFCVTLPFLGQLVSTLQTGTFRRFLHLISSFVVLIELLVFILWYGLDRFCEDVHFMQGIQPKTYMRSTWILSVVLLSYVLLKEAYESILMTKENLTESIGFWLFSLSITFIASVAIVRLLVSACKKRFLESVQLADNAWKPRSELLQRSRAMFSAQAMTKEYLYRQYHLQAGILARQRRANITRQYHV